MMMTPEIQARVVSLLLTVLLAIFFLFIADRKQFFSWKREWEFATLQFSDVLGAFITFLITFLIISPAIMMSYLYLFEHKTVTEMRHLGYLSEAWFGIINNLFMFIALGIYSYKLRDKVRTFFGKKLLFSDFLVGVLSWLISMPVASAVGEIIDIFLGLLREKAVDQTAVMHLKQTAMYPSLFIATSVMVVTIVPFMEELLFRGFLQTWLRQRIGYKSAILYTSIVFAFFHFSANQSYDNFLILGILFTVSCFMGFVYERQKSLLAPIGLHAMFNAVTTFSIFLSG